MESPGTENATPTKPPETTTLTEEQARQVFFKAADEHLREGSYFHSELIVARIEGGLGDVNLVKLMYAWAESRGYPLKSLLWRQFGGIAMLLIGSLMAFVSLSFIAILIQGRRGPDAALVTFLAVLSIVLIGGGWSLFKKVRRERKAHIEKANTICPECDKPVASVTQVCPCGYLNTTPREAVADDTFQTAWEVETPAGLRTYETLSELRAAILNGTISRSMKVNQIVEDTATAGTENADTEKTPQPLNVGDIATGSFQLRSLYQPVWAHTIRGLWIGIVAGISLWLAQLAIAMFFVVNNPIIGGVIVVFLILIFQGVLSAKLNWVVSKILWGAIPGIIAILTVNFGIGAVFQNIGRGLSMQFGAILAGALFGGLLGMMIGTVVGLIRKDKIELAPDAIDEGRDPLTKGLLIPAAVFIVLVILYVYAFVPWMLGFMERNA